MTLIEEVASFAREYINNPQTRTQERKAKISKAIRGLTGKIVGKSCGTCYIEALLIIVKHTKMASSKYELKRGVVLQAFGHPEKTCTNNTITDELGDWYMKHYPEKRVYFARVPRPETPAIPAGVKIVGGDEPVTKSVIEETNSVAEQIEEVVRKPKRRRKTK